MLCRKTLRFDSIKSFNHKCSPIKHAFEVFEQILVFIMFGGKIIRFISIVTFNLKSTPSKHEYEVFEQIFLVILLVG